MNTNVAMRENLCMDQTDETRLASKAIEPILKKSYFKVGSYTYGFDVDTGDILFFFQIEKIYDMGFAKYHFLVEMKNAWRKAGFKIVEEKELPKYEYRRVGFASLCYRIKRIAYVDP